MKTIFLILNVFVLSMMSMFFDVSDTNNLILKEEHHSCKCMSALGSTSSATCTDEESCACTSSFFSCSCDCSPGYKEENAHLDINPGPKENWDKAKVILSTDKTDAVAMSIVDKMDAVYKLGLENNPKFISEANQLNKELENVKQTTLIKLLQAFGA